MPIFIEGGKKVSIHSSFWNALTKNSDSLALSQLWLCGINKTKLRSIGSQIISQLNTYEQGCWSINPEVNNVVLHDANWSQIGTSIGVSDTYLFTRGISFIGDTLNTSRIGSSQVGATKGIIADGRGELTTTNITFLESNISFVDGLLRPWLALAGHRSFKDQKLRCDIELFALEKWELMEPLRVRKSLILRNAVPVSIDAEEYNYTGDKLIERQVQFAFDRYELRIYPATSNQSIDSIFMIPYEDRKPLKDDIKTYYNADVNEDFEEVESYYKADVKEYPDAKKNPNDLSPRSLLNKVGDVLAEGQKTINKVRGKATDITTSVAQGLKAFGADKAATNLVKANQDFSKNLLSPVADVIGTGQGYVIGVDNIGHTVGNITNKSRVDADKIVEALKK